jgi:hypothetical protein
MVLTDNLAVASCMLTAGVKCTIIGGEIDPSHYCTLPTTSLAELPGMLGAGLSQAVLTAAAISVKAGSIAVRARRPDQFRFKQEVLRLATDKILAIDHTKWTEPFDGRYSFDLTGGGIQFVVDSILKEPTYPAAKELAAACEKLNYSLHVAQVSE